VVLDRVRRGQANLSGVDARLAPLLRAALSPVPGERPHADEVLHAMDSYAAGDTLPTLAIPVAPTEQYFLPQEPQVPTVEPAQGAGWAGAPVQPDPRVGWPSRGGTLLALLVGVLGIAAIWPMVAIGMVILWSWGARFADRSIMSVVVRRHDRGRRRSDVPVAIASSPWHGLVAAVMMLVALVIPAIVAVGATFSVALVAAAVAGGTPQPARAAPIVVGGFLGLLMGWWGPGGASLQRGSRSLVRAVAPGKGATEFVVGAFLLIGVGLGAWAWVRNGQPEWWPWSLAQVQAIPGSFW
jgi:hypothetical protein